MIYSSIPWAAPVQLVSKKDGGVRFCIDYRKLNYQIKKDVCPLPKIDFVLDALGKRWTLWILNYASWTYKCPASFQRVMDMVLSGLNWKICMVYIDDIIICSQDFDQHHEHLQEIFNRLSEINLVLCPKMCSICCDALFFLGQKVSNKGLETDSAKIEKVQNAETPKNVKEIKQFLVLASYNRHFIKDISLISAPLSSLTGIFEYCRKKLLYFRERVSLSLSLNQVLQMSSCWQKIHCCHRL